MCYRIPAFAGMTENKRARECCVNHNNPVNYWDAQSKTGVQKNNPVDCFDGFGNEPSRIQAIPVLRRISIRWNCRKEGCAVMIKKGDSLPTPFITVTYLICRKKFKAYCNKRAATCASNIWRRCFKRIKQSLFK